MLNFLNYWIRQFKYNKDVKITVKVILFILIVAGIIFLVSTYLPGGCESKKSKDLLDYFNI